MIGLQSMLTYAWNAMPRNFFVGSVEFVIYGAKATHRVELFSYSVSIRPQSALATALVIGLLDSVDDPSAALVPSAPGLRMSTSRPACRTSSSSPGCPRSLAQPTIELEKAFHCTQMQGRSLQRGGRRCRPFGPSSLDCRLAWPAVVVAANPIMPGS